MTTGLTCRRPGSGARAFGALERAGDRISHLFTAEQLAALAAPTMAAARQWNPLLHLMSAEVFGEVLLGVLTTRPQAGGHAPS